MTRQNREEKLKQARELLVLDERVRLFYGNLVFSALVTLVLSAFLVWFSGALATAPLRLWGALMLTVVIALLALAWAWNRRKQSRVQPQRWQYLALLPVLFAGLGWGMVAAYPYPDYSEQVPLLLSLTAGAGLLMTLLLISSIELLTLLFLLAAVLPLAIRVFSSTQMPSPVQMALLVASVLALSLVAAALNVVFGTVARLRAGKRNVSGKLDLVREEVQGLHSRLSDEDLKRRDVEHELYLAKEAAETANMVKSEFLATMSHEIRTPLNGIVPLLEILRDSELTAEQRQYVLTALNSSHHLLSIINDILDYTKIEAGKLELEMIELAPAELLDSVVVLMAKSAERKGLKLGYSVGVGVPERLRGDPIRLRQILTNLVSNAIKFTEKGSIQVEVNRRELSRRDVELVFSVRDTGVGMSPETQARLFRSFSQADASTTRKHGGTGLGLVICKRLVELMDGRIGVESEPGKGSVFWFNVRLRRSVEDSPRARDSLAGSRVLLLSEGGRNCSRLNGLFDHWELIHECVDSEEAARTKLTSSAALGRNWAFDLLVLESDSMGDELEGFLQQLHAETSLSNLPVLVLEGETTLDEALHHVGLVEALPADIGRIELERVLNNLLDVRNQNSISLPETEVRRPPVVDPALLEDTRIVLGRDEDEDPKSAQGSSAPLAGRVLVVEDNPVNLNVARKLLQRLGLSCEAVDDGLEALKAVEKTHYDLILMDCQMPRMDGYQATRAIRLRETSKGLAHQPVIAMTANAMAGDREKCLDAGMDDYLAKPLLPAAMERMIRRWLPAAGDMAPDAGTDDLLLPDDPPPTTRVGGSIDQGVIDELYEIMEEDFVDLLDTFLDNAPQLLRELQAAVDDQDVDRAILPSHSLKSGSANVGALGLSQQAREIEMAARVGDLQRVSVLLPELLDHFDQVSRELREICERRIP